MKKTSILFLATILFISQLWSQNSEEIRVAVFDPVIKDTLINIISIREEIMAEFGNTEGYTVVERAMIDQILKENHVQAMGLVSEDKYIKMGESLDAKYVCVCAITLLDDKDKQYHVSLKLINVENFKVEKHKTAISKKGVNDLSLFVRTLTRNMLSEKKHKAQIVWGPKVSLNYSVSSMKTGSSGAGYTSTEGGKPSFDAGLMAYYSLSNQIYLSSGLVFSMKKFDYYASSNTLYFIDLPLYLGYAFSPKKSAFYAQAGPFVGYKFKDSTTEMVDFDGSVNAGLGVGLGYNFNRIRIELGYQQSLTKMSITDYGTSHSGDITLMYLSAGICYIFP